jgi:hypothetical protein
VQKDKCKFFVFVSEMMRRLLRREAASRRFHTCRTEAVSHVPLPDTPDPRSIDNHGRLSPSLESSTDKRPLRPSLLSPISARSDRHHRR